MCTQNRPMISIIIPVFNAEAYLYRCLKSIQEQTNKNFEVIIIDDGSTDQSINICQEFTEKDNRFKVYQKENGGVSSARNMGLNHAIGDFIFFADADDWISPDFLNMTEEEQKYDIIQKSYAKEYSHRPAKYYSIHKAWSTHKKEEILRFFVSKRTSALWDKIISRRLIHNLFFNENIHIGEDFIFFISLIQIAQNYILSPIGCYHYNIHQGSSIQKIKTVPSKSITHYFSLMDKMEKVSKDHTLFINLIAQFNLIQLYQRKKYMDLREKEKFKKIFLSIKSKDLKYLNNKWKFKFLSKKYSFILFN